MLGRVAAIAVHNEVADRGLRRGPHLLLEALLHGADHRREMQVRWWRSARRAHAADGLHEPARRRLCARVTQRIDLRVRDREEELAGRSLFRRLGERRELPEVERRGI